MVRRKKKIKKLAKIILVIIILITIGISGYFVYNKYFKDEKQVSEVSKLMNEHNIPEDEYSKTLEFVLLNNIYNEEYLFHNCLSNRTIHPEYFRTSFHSSS